MHFCRVIAANSNVTCQMKDFKSGAEKTRCAVLNSKGIVQYRCFYVYMSKISHIFLMRYTLSVFISPQEKFHFNQVRLLICTSIGSSYSLQKNRLTMCCFSDPRKINFWISRKNKPNQNKAIVVLNFKSIKSKFICSKIKFRVPI